MIYRLGTYVPVPGINPEALAQAFEANQSGIIGMFNMFAGGAVGRMAIFALGVMPYISSSIIMQLMTSIVPTLEQLKKEGEQGRKVINQRLLVLPWEEREHATLRIALKVPAGDQQQVGIKCLNGRHDQLLGYHLTLPLNLSLASSKRLYPSRLDTMSNLFERIVDEVVLADPLPPLPPRVEKDVRKLLDVLHALVEQGNTVIVIEHNLEVIKTADWIVDLGPEGGDKGGRVVASGTPEDVARAAGSFTGDYLAAYLPAQAKKTKRRA